MTGLVQQYVASQRASLGRRFRIARPPRGQPPDAAERGYRAYLLSLVNAVHDDIRDYLLDRVPAMVRLAQDDVDAVRADVEDVEAVLQTASETITARLNNKHLRDLQTAVEQYRAATSQHVLLQLRRQIRRMISLDAMPPVGTPERAAMDAFLRQNVKLITSLTGDYVDQVEDLVMRGVQAGDRAAVIQAKIEARWPVAQSRAALIARDQISKLQGTLTRVRQQSLGIDRYIWRTSRDERVRETHLTKEGKVFSWAKPPPDTGHPGQDYQCRCTAEPYIEGEPPPAEDRDAVIAAVRDKREAMLQERGSVGPQPKR